MDVTQQEGKLLQIKSPRGTRLQQEARIGLLFLSPWLIGFVLLKALPIIAAFVFSLTDFKMLTPTETKFIGLENYIRYFNDPIAGASLFGSLGYFLLTVPLEMIVALALAAIFTSARLKNKRTSRTLIFMTSIIPATSIFFIFLGSLEYAQRLIILRFDLPPIEGGFDSPSIAIVDKSCHAHVILLDFYESVFGIVNQCERITLLTRHSSPLFFYFRFPL